jgi:hypothetical protein
MQQQWTSWVAIMWERQQYTHNNRGTIGNSVLYLVCAKGL